MANRSELTSGLQRLVQDTAAAEYPVTELHIALNESLHSIQEFILMIDPEAFAVWETRNIVANERYYLRPVDIVWDFELGYSETPSSIEYAALDKRPFREIRGNDAGRAYTEADSTNYYAKIGSYYYLGWNPDAAIADGLQVIYTPWLAMDEDNDVPAISVGFHRAIKVDAAVKLLQESPDDTTKLERERAEFYEKIKLYYQSSLTGPDTLSMDLGKTY